MFTAESATQIIVTVTTMITDHWPVVMIFLSFFLGVRVIMNMIRAGLVNGTIFKAPK